jgi:hypothetical protein
VAVTTAAIIVLVDQVVDASTTVETARCNQFAVFVEVMHTPSFADDGSFFAVFQHCEHAKQVAGLTCFIIAFLVKLNCQSEPYDKSWICTNNLSITRLRSVSLT